MMSDEYEACLHDEAVNNFVKRKAFRDEWKSTYQSMMPSKVLDFLRQHEKQLRENFKLETDRFDSPALRLCIFINAMNAYPGNKITTTLRNSLIRTIRDAIDFIPTLKTQMSAEAVEALTELISTQKTEQEKLNQEETIRRLLQTAKTLRENPKTNLMARYEINREFIGLLKDGRYATPQVADYWLDEGNDWYKMSKISEAIEWIETAKFIFNQLAWTPEVEKCERMIAYLKTLPKM